MMGPRPYPPPLPSPPGGPRPGALYLGIFLIGDAERANHNVPVDITFRFTLSTGEVIAFSDDVPTSGDPISYGRRLARLRGAEFVWPQGLRFKVPLDGWVAYGTDEWPDHADGDVTDPQVLSRAPILIRRAAAA